MVVGLFVICSFFGLFVLFVCLLECAFGWLVGWNPMHIWSMYLGWVIDALHGLYSVCVVVC